MIVTRSDIESFKRFVPKLALAGAAVLILSAFAPSSDAETSTRGASAGRNGSIY